MSNSKDKVFFVASNKPIHHNGEDQRGVFKILMFSGPNSGKRKKALSRVDGVLSRVVHNLGLEQRLKERTLMDLWPTAAGEVLGDRSRCLFIDYKGTLVISVRDASTGHELSLLKPQLFKKMQVAARGLSIELTGLRFDLKHFHKSEVDYTNLTSAPPLPEPSSEDLANIVLGESELNELQQAVSEFEHAQSRTIEDLPSRLAALFERQLRLKQWRKKHGYPVCSQCKDTTSQALGSAALCSSCYFNSLKRVAQDSGEQKFS